MTYQSAKAAIEAKIARLQELLQELDALENEGKPAQNGHAAFRPSGLRAAVNPDGKSWSDAIADVLSDGRARTVAEIVEGLQAAGRRFGPNTRPDAQVRATLHRGAKSNRWSHAGRPAKWRIPKGGSS